MSAARARPAAFLDRDGTLIEEHDYLADPGLVALLPGAARALVLLERAGYARVLASNQSGIARGLLDELELAEIHAELQRQLAREGAGLDLVLYCPHHPHEGREPYRLSCNCRKPAPGMLLQAAAELELDLARSFSIGDMARDLEAGEAVGARGILVLTGKGGHEQARLATIGRRPLVARDLLEAVEGHVLGREIGSGRSPARD